MSNIVSPTDLQLNDEVVIQIKRVSKATTGGRRMRFNSVVVVGDGQGHVGIGFGKANEVASAVNKAKEAAKKKEALVVAPPEEEVVVEEEKPKSFSGFAERRSK